MAPPVEPLAPELAAIFRSVGAALSDRAARVMSPIVASATVADARSKAFGRLVEGRFKRRARRTTARRAVRLAAWGQLESKFTQLTYGAEELVPLLSAAVDRDEDALRRLRDLDPDLAALVELAISGTPAAWAAFALVLAMFIAEPQTVDPSAVAVSACDSAASDDKPPRLRQIQRVILRHGPDSASRELQAA
jgi:hypothetical protein